MKVSLIQVDVRDDDPFKKRMERILGLIRAERGADLVVLPELWPRGPFAFDDWGSGDRLDGSILSAIAEAARDANCCVHAGGIIEQNPNGRPYNTAALFGRDGERIAVYRKIHLFGFDKGEAVLLDAGNQIVTAETPLGSFGLATCFDLRFPEQFRSMVANGATLFIVPSGWPIERAEHWRLLLRARAVENQAFVLGCATVGHHSGKTMSGYSAIISPFGKVLAEASADREEVLRAEIDLTAIAKTRREFPVLEWRREGLESVSTAQ